MTDLYIAEGLTIGRSEANTVCLTDDDTIDRSHARVDRAADGSLCLRSQSATGPILEHGQPVTEVVLQPGRTFQIGGAQFECLSGLVETPSPTQHFDRCPDCGSTNVNQTGHLPRACPDCGLSQLPIRSGEDKPVQFVPAEYGDYTAVRYVARGGMGLVLQGLTPDGRHQVAIKLLMSREDNQDAVRRFRDEVQSLERINHPHVVRVLTSGKTSGFSYLIMEWIDGRSLRDIIQQNRKDEGYCDAATASRWFREVLQGLSAIHEAGMIHRDIKPANILIASDGHARVSDLGLVKQLGDEATACTTTGMVPGTFEYMSPEQLSGSAPVDQRSDLYSLGVTFYELLTGDRPHGVWVPPSQINPQISEALDSTLKKLLSRVPDNRNQTATGVLGKLSITKSDVLSPYQSDTTETAQKRTVAFDDSGHGTIGVLKLGCAVYTVTAACVILALLVAGFTPGKVVLFMIMFGLQGLMFAGLTYSAVRGYGRGCRFMRDFVQARIPRTGWASEALGRWNSSRKSQSGLDSSERATAPSNVTASGFRHPWQLWGGTAIAAGLVANELNGVLLALGSRALIEWSEGLLGIATVAGLVICGFGILDKYWLSRGKPVKPSPELRLTMNGMFILMVALIQLSVTITAMSGALAATEEAEAVASNSQPQVLRSPDGLCEITVPGGWGPNAELATIQPTPAIQAANASGDSALLVRYEAKADLRPMTHDEYMNLITDNLASALGDPKRKPTIHWTSGALPAKSTEVSGFEGAGRMVYRIVTFETPDRYFCVVAWTTPTQEATVGPQLDAIAKSFRVPNS
tara:strand:- start:14534 stop:16948 length:2415 start_codon:yes stop_codon:yes gene_type:complete